MTENTDGAEPCKVNRKTRINNSSHSRRLYGLAILIGLAGVLQFVSFSDAAAKSVTTSGFEQLNQQSLRSTWPITDFKHSERKGYKQRNLFGANSGTWSFDVEGSEVKASVDGPFDSWHDLRLCYSGTGWTVVNSWTDNLNTPEGMVVERSHDLRDDERVRRIGPSDFWSLQQSRTDDFVIQRSFDAVDQTQADRPALQNTSTRHDANLAVSIAVTSGSAIAAQAKQQTLFTQYSQLLPQVLKQWEANE